VQQESARCWINKKLTGSETVDRTGQIPPETFNLLKEAHSTLAQGLSFSIVVEIDQNGIAHLVKVVGL
jgi:hypothetical protein